MNRLFFFLLFGSCSFCFSQNQFPHLNAHAHNDYEHTRPLKDALQNRFISVEADVHLQDGKLLVSHNRPEKNSSTLEKLYLNSLDSLLKSHSGFIYELSTATFYLMIDIKTDGEATYQAFKKTLSQYPALSCSKNCPVKIFISGNRPIDTIVKEGYSGIAIDGRPDDVGKGYSSELIPVISDHFKNWSDWNGKSELTTKDLARVKELAHRIHAEGKKIRLWAIPDNEKAWEALLNAGVDFINTDHLQELNAFLSKRK